jgi:hypothetical protein
MSKHFVPGMDNLWCNWLLLTKFNYVFNSIYVISPQTGN